MFLFALEMAKEVIRKSCSKFNFDSPHQVSIIFNTPELLDPLSGVFPGGG
jgi:hypothetical protein